MGLGDNIYSRGFVSQLKEDVSIITPWPQLYKDLNVKCVQPATKLRTQRKNIINSNEMWSRQPYGHALRIFYNQGENIVDRMRDAFKVDPVFTLPDFGPSPFSSVKPIAIIRPVTVRKEWMNVSRNPLPKYVNQAAEILSSKGYHVISIADLEDGQEWIEGDMPYADERFHKGELNVEQLLSAIQHASVVVGGVGFIVPASIAANTPLFIIHGGQGASNSFDKITNKKHMDLSKVGYAAPKNMCMCKDNTHQCNKDIDDFYGRFQEWLDMV